MDKKIVLIPNEQPQLIGAWTIGEVRQMAASLAQWVDNLPLTKLEEVTDEEAE